MAQITETMQTNIKNETPDYSTLYQKRGRPKMKPEDKKLRKRKTTNEPAMEIQQVEPNDDLVHKLEVLKEQWNEYYKRNRERILKRKKELRETTDTVSRGIS
jgi:hypothetical protein